MISAVISSSVLIVIVIILRAICRGKISSRLQYAIWGLVLIRMLLPFNLYSSPVSIMNVLKPSSVIDTISEKTENYTENKNNINKPSNQAASAKINGNTSDQSTLKQISENKPLPSGKSLTTAVEIVWVCGIFIVGIWFAVTNIRFYTKLKRLRKPFAVSNTKLPVYIANDLPSPCLFGMYHPVIYLTSRAIKDEETIRHVLTHELTHYAHKDHIWAFLRSASLILYWFNPLVWIAANLSKIDCELACDESTIKKLGEENRIRYGRTLVDLISINSKPMDVICTSTTMTLAKHEMKERIMMITKRPKTILFALITVVIIIIVTILCTFTGPSRSVESEAATMSSKETFNDTLEQKLKTALPYGSKIKASYIDDFDKDNRLEMFGLISFEKENTEVYFENQVWYTDESGPKKLFDGGIYPDTAKVWDVGKQKLFFVEEGYGGSGSRSHVWSVKEGIPYELKHAGEGLEKADNLNFYIYPSKFDLMPDGTGHTWKRYYLYFDEATGDFKEYGGIVISREDFLKLKGATRIYDEIIKNGYKVSDIFYRQNGIININYNNSEYNFNVNLTVQDGAVSIIDKYGSIKDPDYDHGGSYKAAIFSDIATYPENMNSVLKSSQTKD